jgi:tripartite-type tricarboxylate transporter receptor subunit TctC
VIENKAGAAGRIAVETVKAAEPDGHTLLLGTAGLMTMFPHAYPRLGYDPVRDFAPLVNAARFELALVVHQSVPAQTLAEFLAWARTQGRRASS